MKQDIFSENIFLGQGFNPQPYRKVVSNAANISLQMFTSLLGIFTLFVYLIYSIFKIYLLFYFVCTIKHALRNYSYFEVMLTKSRIEIES